jgi:hypothetical protein
MLKVNDACILEDPIITSAWKQRLYFIRDVRGHRTRFVFWQGEVDGEVRIASMHFWPHMDRGRIVEESLDEMKKKIEMGWYVLETEDPETGR